jgi:protein-disulfide isomerase
MGAPVTIVEFSDFQCPFCRRFALMLHERWRETTTACGSFSTTCRWATTPGRAAAEGAARAQLQGSNVFWPLHDRLFENQGAITPDNIKQKLVEYAQEQQRSRRQSVPGLLGQRHVAGFGAPRYRSGRGRRVNGTPTLFINGHRVQGVKDWAQLRQMIAEAAKPSP